MKLPNGDRVIIPMEKILPKLLDTVAVLISLNADRLLQVESDAMARLPLPIGLVGTVVEVGIYEIALRKGQKDFIEVWLKKCCQMQRF